MGEVTEKLCDYVFVTSDNPRFEEPEQIAKEIVQGIKGNNFEVILDRRQAIARAVNFAKAGDTIAICGKGAEDYLEIKGQKYPYSDKQVLLDLNFVQE